MLRNLLPYLLFSALLNYVYLTGPSCSRPLPEGMGSNHQVIVIADPKDWERLEKRVREVFERTVRTPQIEKIFTVEAKGSEEFDFYCKWKNLVLLSSLQAKGKTSNLIHSLLSPQALEKVNQDLAYMFVKRDVWAKEQVLMVLTARNYQTLDREIEANSEEIFSTMEGYLNQKIENWLYREDEQFRREKELLRKFGWTIRLPSGYRVERELSDSNFVWLRKRNPDRWLFVYWEEGGSVENLNEEWCLDKRDQVCRLFYEGDRILRDETEALKTSFGGMPAVKLDGLWENEEKLVGGPFRSWCFVDPVSRRFFMIDTALYAPAFEKEPYLRQLEIIARTFSTKGSGRLWDIKSVVN